MAETRKNLESVQAQPESAPLAHEDEVLAFLRKQHADMMQAVASRRDSANVLRNCSASDIKAGRKLAMKMSGRKMPHTTVAQERAAADVQDRIASKIEREADLMQQAIDRLALSAAPPAQPHPSQREIPSPYDASVGSPTAGRSNVNTRDQSPYTLTRNTSLRRGGNQ